MAKTCDKCGGPRVRYTVVNQKTGYRTRYCRACARQYKASMKGK